jgi:hypothetical protein
MAAALPGGDATQRPSAANNAMTMETCIIGCDQGVDLRAGPGSVPDGHGCDPDHGTGITVAAIIERTALEGVTNMKFKSIASLLALSFVVLTSVPVLAAQDCAPG